jgi:hypothetical protein
VAAPPCPYAEVGSLLEFFVELQPQETRTRSSSTTRAWQPIRPEESTHLSDARLQLHHAAQFGAAAGISFLEHQPDGRHANLEWVPALAGLFSRVIPARTPFRIGVRPADLTLLIVTEKDQSIGRYRLHGRTIVEATQWIRAQIARLGADAARYTLKRDYEIPRHPVAMGDSFDASERSQFEELSKWFTNGASILNSLARSIHDASEVRCWPHHLDIATLVQVASERTIGVGLEPGDHYYDEPYFYVDIRPQPPVAQARTRPLWGRGKWHTREWVGAVLPGSRLEGASAQERQVREFMDSAVSACRALATQS